MPIAVSVLGASGKMGNRIHQLASKDADFQVVGIVARQQMQPSDQGRIPSIDLKSAIACCDVAIDFSSHEVTQRHLEAAVLEKKPLVIGTTGHLPDSLLAIEEAAKTIPILYSPNFSFGIALCLEAAARFAKALSGSCSIDIVETHHIHKKDTPSGTALAFAQAARSGMPLLEKDCPQPRDVSQVVIHSIRSGEVIGEHTIIFECGHERIELKHTSHSRDAFAKGALMGAKFLVQKSPGLYSLKDLFTCAE